MDLAEFVAARLDEDEAAANAWLPVGNPTSAQREHIASADPGRMLREVEAKRKILALAAEADDIEECLIFETATRPPQAGRVTIGDKIRRQLASAWSDHPDYALVTAPALP